MYRLITLLLLVRIRSRGIAIIGFGNSKDFVMALDMLLDFMQILAEFETRPSLPRYLQSRNVTL